MKTRKQLLGLIAMAIMAIAIIALPLAGCKEDEPDPPPPQEYPQKQPDTPRTLSFGTVTIKSDDQFTATERKTLCDKVVAALEKGYTGAPNDGMRTNIATYFANNTVTVVLLKSATNDVEVKSGVLKTIYFKANASAIDGISGNNLFNAIAAMMGSASYPTP